MLRLRGGCRIKPHQWPRPAPLFTHARLDVIPQVNTTVARCDDIVIASPNFIAFLHKHAPGCIQDLPVRFSGPHAKSLRGFRIINWLRKATVAGPRGRIAKRAMLPITVPAFVARGKSFYRDGEVLITDALKVALSVSGLPVRFQKIEIDDPLLEIERVYNHRVRQFQHVPSRALPHRSRFDPRVLLNAGLTPQEQFVIAGSDVLHSYVVWGRGGYNLNLTVLRRLLAAGAFVNTPHAPNFQSLANSIFDFRVPLIQLLSRYGIDWNVSNPNGMTPLLCALTDGRFKGAKELIRCGARIDFRNVRGMTALEMLEEEHASCASRRTYRSINLLRKLSKAR